MRSVEELDLIEEEGIVGNADRGGWRQVTIISEERWARAASELEADVEPALRRANVMVSGVELADSRGRILALGGCRIELRGETRPCKLMDEQHPGLRDALQNDWGGGAFGVILDSGTVRVGDPVRFLESSA